MDYKLYFTYEDILYRGYDLKADGRLNSGDFATKESAIDDFLQENFNSVYDLIESYKGREWTKKFFLDMQEDIKEDVHPRTYELKQILKWSLMEQTIFIYENGDIMTSAQIQPDKIGYSPKVIRKLWSNNLLG